MKTYAIILAAGKGTRMKSDLPKVLHSVGGKPMVQHLVDILHKINVDEIVVVVGHKSELLKESIKGNVHFVEQIEQKGTAHAVLQAAPLLKEKIGNTLILTGDTPLIEQQTLEQLIIQHRYSDSKGTVLTTLQEEPKGYGRIIRDINAPTDLENQVNNYVLSIVEEKDTTLSQKRITEVNTGIFCVDNQLLFAILPQIKNHNAQKEYYLTDIVSEFNHKGEQFEGHFIPDASQVMGINDRLQLSIAEQVMRERINKFHMLNGVTLVDPNSTYIDKDVKIGCDTIIYPNVSLKGETTIGSHSVITSGTEILDSEIGSHSLVKQSLIYNSKIGNNVTVGPFAHIRPETNIGDRAKIGNFVELKKVTLGEDSKVNHLSYLGDAEIGARVNVGCGSITVNYDGKNKHQTIIKDGAFIGCNSNLVAPVVIEKNAFIAAGSTITKDVPEDSLGIARARQENKMGYLRRKS